MGKLPGRNALAPCLREDRKVARDGFVNCGTALRGPLEVGWSHRPGGTEVDPGNWTVSVLVLKPFAG